MAQIPNFNKDLAIFNTPSHRWVVGLFITVVSLLLLQLTVSSFSRVNSTGEFLSGFFVPSEPAGENEYLTSLTDSAVKVYKPLFISDNYSRCQAKLGFVASESLQSARNLSKMQLSPGYVLDELAYRDYLKYMFSIGSKYVVVNVAQVPLKSSPDDPLIVSAKAVLREADKNFLVPIINVLSTQGTNSEKDVEAMMDFYTLISSEGKGFIATTTPDNYVNTDIERSIQTSLKVARQLYLYPNILVASPNLWLEKDSGIDKLEAYVNHKPTQWSNLESEFDVDGRYYKAYPYDVILFTAKNSDYDFKNTQRNTSEGGSSVYARTAHWLYADPMGGERYVGKQFIRDHNRGDKVTKRYLENGTRMVEIKARPNVQAIIMGFAQADNSLPNGFDQAAMERFLYDYARFSDDPTVKAVILGPELEAAVLSGYRSGKITVGLDQFYDRLNQMGTNCNYDVADLKEPYDLRSVAVSCEKRDSDLNDSRNKSISGNIVCTPDGTQYGKQRYKCETTLVSTIQIGIPIRLCGANTPFGTDTKAVMPYSARVANMLFDVTYDPMNQFASQVVVDGRDYQVPWLGTCINSAGQLQKVQSYQFQSFPNRASYNVATEDELIKESQRVEQPAFDTFAKTAYSSRFGRDYQSIVLDEQTIYYGSRIGFSTDNISLLNSNRVYSQEDFSNVHARPLACSGDVEFIDIDPQNMVYGSEMILEEEAWSGTGEEMCYAGIIGGKISGGGLGRCGEYNGGTTQSPCTCDNWDQRVNEFYGYDRDNPPPVTIQNIRTIGCRINNEKVNRCLIYRGGSGPNDNVNYMESGIRYTSKQPAAPSKLEIEGIYDALATSYIQLQTSLSQRNLKMIFNEKHGWKADVTIKSYVKVPGSEEKFLIEDARENQMLEVAKVPVVERPAISSSGGSSSGGVSLGGSCKLGVNYGTFVGIPDERIQQTAAFGYGYAQFMFTSPEQLGSQIAYDQVTALCSKGIAPVIRSCYAGDNGCAFGDGAQQGQSLAEFSKKVADACGENIYMACGHNEPAFEYDITQDSFTNIIQEAGWSKSCVDSFNRNSGQGKLMSPIFNGTYDLGDNGTPTNLDDDRNYTNHIKLFIERFGGLEAYKSAFMCTAVNAYSQPFTISKHLDDISAITGGHPFCVNEFGVSNLEIGEGDPSPDKNAEAAVDVNGRSDVIFALGFNWLKTRDDSDPNQNWASFAPTDCGRLALERACGITLDSGLSCDAGSAEGSSSNITSGLDAGGNNAGGAGDIIGFEEIDPAATGDFLISYNHYLAEGDNWNDYEYYFEALYYLDEIARLLDVYGPSAGGIPSLATEVTEDGEVIFKSGKFEKLTTVFTCDDFKHDPEAIAALEKVRADTGNPDFMFNCLATSAIPGTKNYQLDPLGEFLCNQGYNIGNQCDLQCFAPSYATRVVPNTTVAIGDGSPNPLNINPGDVNQPNPYLYPVGSDLAIPGCVEPPQVVNVNSPLPYFAGGSPSPEAYPFQLVPEAAESFNRMIAAMPQFTRSSCGVNWGYRSASTQSAWDAKCGANRGTACSCHSEHQLGTVVDFNTWDNKGVGEFYNTACYDWLNKNAADYGWVRSYLPKNPDKYGAPSIGEPWHWRWLPGDHAKEFKENISTYKHLKTYLLGLAGAEPKPEDLPAGSVGFRNPTCPFQDDPVCTQGPLGTTSHACAKKFSTPRAAYDYVADRFVAPEDGVIVKAIGHDSGQSIILCDSSDPTSSIGSLLEFYGDSGIHYRFLHIDFSEEESEGMVGRRMKGGDLFKTGDETRNIGMYSRSRITCFKGKHIHVEAKIGGDGTNWESGQVVNMFQLFGDILNCNGAKTGDCGLTSCSAPNWVNLINTSGGGFSGGYATNKDGLICALGQSDSIPDGPTGCKEFGCMDGSETFKENLECAVNTLSGDIYDNKGLAVTLDEYGPFCDTITSSVVCTESTVHPTLDTCKLFCRTTLDRKKSCVPNKGGYSCEYRCTNQEAQDNEYSFRSNMPFASGFLNAYNSASPVKCNVVMPRSPRREDVNLKCNAFPNRFDDLTTDEWQYYRAALDQCNDQLTWDSVAAGKTVDEIAEHAFENVWYQKDTQFIVTLKDNGYGGEVPIEKVKAVVQAASDARINPYMLIAIWGTESEFGKANQACNVF